MWLVGGCLFGQLCLAVATEIQSKLFTAMQILPVDTLACSLTYLYADDDVVDDGTSIGLNLNSII